MPLDVNGKLDYNKALTGDDLNDFVNLKLFPYLKNFKTIAQSSDTIEYKIGEIFSELKNKIASGYGLREIIELIGKLRFRTYAEKHEMSHLYEAKIKNMGNAGRNGSITEVAVLKDLLQPIAGELFSPLGGYAGLLEITMPPNSVRVLAPDIEPKDGYSLYKRVV